MKKVCLFIAMSLDGFIADHNGGVEWLVGQGNNDDNMKTYDLFVKGIDTVLMGWNTYHQIATELSPDRWLYSDFTTYVFTHKEHASSENIHFVNANPNDFVQTLKTEEGRDIWICGGANLIQQFVNEDTIDQYHICVIPTLLGTGICLFEEGKQEIKLKLIHTQSYNGITDLVYERR